jgi:hypothetical protein
MPTTPRSDRTKTKTQPNKATPRPADPEREESLDETIESTFPASDAPSSIPDPEPKSPRKDDARDSD